MSTSAVIMMIVAMLVLWGGLGLAIWNISRSRSEQPDTAYRDL